MDENLFSRPCSGDASSSPRKTTRAASALLKLLAALGIVVILIAFFLPAVRNGGARLAANRNMCANQLHQIALAIRSYVDAHHALPPLYTTDADGKPLHSWRTLILPFLDQARLYNEYRFDEPWDGPNNRKLAGRLRSYQRGAPWPRRDRSRRGRDPGNSSRLSV